VSQGRPEQRGRGQYIIYLNDEDKLKLLIFLYDHSFLVVVFTIYWNPIACGNTSFLRARPRQKKKKKKKKKILPSEKKKNSTDMIYSGIFLVHAYTDTVTV